MNEYLEFIVKYLELNSVVFNKEQAEKLALYLDLMLKKNEVMNLTAIKEPSEAALKHIADSALCVKYLKPGKLLDVGSGAGLPSFPIAILRPDIKVTALDSTKKKTDFINETASIIGLDNLKATFGRAEELSHGAMRGYFDNVTARAVADMNVLCELCIPFVKVGGIFVALKGKNGEEETEKSKSAIKQLSGKLESVNVLPLIGGEDEQTRVITVVSKVDKTPLSFPRPYARIIKRPL